MLDKDALDKMQSGETEFALLVIDSFRAICRRARLIPTFSPSVMTDAWESFRWDTKRLKNNMPGESTPDHFKICGFAAYWLRRNSPVVDLIKDGGEMSSDEAHWREFFGKYSRAFLAFSFGDLVCSAIERNAQKNTGRQPRPLDMDYLESICYVMKYKNLSPHAMGMIYRSLYYETGAPR